MWQSIKDRLAILRPVAAYWHGVHKNAFSEAAAALGLESRVRVMIGAIGVVVVLVCLAFWGSAEASRDEMIVRLAIAGVVIGLFPFVYLWKMVSIPARLDEETKRKYARPVNATLPLSITTIWKPSYSRYSGLPALVSYSGQGEEKQIEVDPPCFRIEEIFISNISLHCAVTLRIFLVITDERGKTQKIHGDGKNSWGHALGYNDLLTKISKKNSMPPPNYITSPVSIPPQTTIRGSLQFIIGAFVGIGGDLDDKVLNYYVPRSQLPNEERWFSYQLEIEDVISGVRVLLPLPSPGYKGE
jgi:hypothetical protein